LTAYELDDIIDTYTYFAYDYYFLYLEVDNINDPPAVQILTPFTDKTFSQSLTFSYSGTDPNDDTLTYDIYYASDGVTFDNLIANDISDTTYTWSIGSISDGSNYRIKVITKDEHGLTQSAVSEKFTINNPETITLVSPTLVVNSSIQTVIIETNGVSAELILNGTSKGVQTSGFEWTVALVEGENLLEVIVLDAMNTETRKTFVVVYQIPTTNVSSFPSYFWILTMIGLYLISLTKRKK